ncbi:MAG: DUF3088 domain-containing protein [Pseudomonadota bacterium]
MTTKHILFTLNPWFENGKGPYYCPDCAVVEGFLHYSPEIRAEIEIISVDFPRPREEIVKLLGQENQSCPVLVLADETGLPEGGKQSLSTGRKFINNGLAICNFLADTFNGVMPHP